MELSLDEIAGIVDIFGGLTNGELNTAMEEIAFRRDDSPVSQSWLDQKIEQATEEGILVRQESHDPPLLCVGPVAFPVEPDGAEDLPYILDIPERTVDRESLANELLQNMEADISDTMSSNQRTAYIELSYDIETWSGVDTSQLRDALDTNES